MSKLKYDKPALTFKQQLEHLQKNGLSISNQAEAYSFLASVNYYRLSGYWYPFRKRDASGNISSQFILDAQFEDAVRLYDFDQKLRRAVLDALEKIEIAVRTRITYHMGHKYGAFAHTDAANFHNKFNHAIWLEKLENETLRSSDKFIQHYKNKYTSFPRIPVWMLTEVISFGALSFFYMGLRNDRNAGVEDKKIIADYFNLHHKRLGDWLHTLTYIRNICAHHGRLWNRELAIRPDKAKQTEWLPPLTPRNDRIFYILLMLRHLLKPLAYSDDWSLAITELIEPIAENDFYRKSMGVPKNWKEHPLWK